MPETTLTLLVKTTGNEDRFTRNEDRFTTHLYVNDDLVTSKRTLSVDASQEQRALSERYLALFEQRGLPLVERAALEEFGTMLFDTWLADAWDAIEGRWSPANSLRFVVASDHAAVLNLPWSLLRLPDAHEPLGLNSNASIRLHPHPQRLPEATGNRRPGQLRVLYSACAPVDQGSLGYEDEEYRLLQTFTRYGNRVHHFGCDLGSFAEFRDRVREYRSHVVHLTGHGYVVKGEGHFAFEDERGKTDLRAGSSIASDVLAGRGVQCVFVSGCKTAQAPDVDAISGICQGIVRRGVPMAVGWAASILDDVAAAFTETFYAEISAGSTVDRAVVQARRDAHDLCTERVDDERSVDASWTLPVLYTATTQARLFDDQKPDEAPPKPTVLQNALPGVNALPGMAEGHADYFIGRRREQQRLLPGLRLGTLNTVFLTGVGGVGKSTLATRLARALQKDDFTPIAIPSSETDPLSAGRLLERCCVKLPDDVAKRLTNGDIDLRRRLRLLVDELNQNRFVLVLDNFESNMDRGTRAILQEDLSWFVSHLVRNLTGSSRCILTSRYSPRELDGDLPKMAREEALGDFPESSFFKYVLNDADVEQRYRSGELSPKTLQRVYTLLGGTPRFLEQVREVLATLPADAFDAKLDTDNLPDDADENELRARRDTYVEDLFVSELYAAIEPEAARDALSRAAVYTIPVTANGMAAAAHADASDVQTWVDAWQRRTFLTPIPTYEGPQRWTVPTLLRTWLLHQIDADTRRAAHHDAGTWLMDVYDADRENDERGLHFLEVELEARSRFLDAESYDRARQITDHVSNLFVGRALYDEVIRLNEEMVDRAPHPSPLNWLGRAHIARANYGQAEEAYRRARRAAVGSDRKEEAAARHGLASIALRQGEYDRARSEFGEALEILQEIGDRSGEAATRHNLATIAMEQGEYDRARSEFGKSLEIKQAIGDRSGEATTRHNLATIAVHQGEYDWARSEFGEALEIRREIGDRSGEAATFGQLGVLAVEGFDRVEPGLRLLLLAYVMLSGIGHARQQTAWGWVADLASRLGWSEDDLKAAAQEVQAAYDDDGGWGLVRAAFEQGGEE